MDRIATSTIDATGRLRAVDPKRVAVLSDSIKEVGLLNPITVQADTIIRGGQQVAGFVLIAGAHRLRACQDLGWTDIPAVIVDLCEQQRIIAECDENLCVSELSPADRALFTARRKEAYEWLHPEARHGANQHTRGVDKLSTPSFAHDQADKTGVDARTVRRDADRGAKVSPAALAMVRGTKLDTGVYLDTLKSVPVERQTATVKRDLTTPKPIRVADEPDTDEAAVERQVAALMSAWNRAGPDARAEFLERIA
jgi:ParB family chromosome partitioning protein